MSKLFSISFSELILITIIILTLFHPKELLAIILILYQLYLKLRQNIQMISNDIESNIIEKTIDNNNFDIITNNEEPENLIYYQPELDFEKEPELFDEINL